MNPFRVDHVSVRRLLVLMSLPLVALLLAGLATSPAGSRPDDTLRDLRTFSEVIQLASRNYVDEVGLALLERGAYQGLAESLGPWASHRDATRMAEIEQGDRSGDIGVLLLKHPQQYVRVVLVLPGSPADEAGLLRAQYIETIDGRATKDMPLAEAAAMLRGAPGTVTKLGMFRSRDEEAGRVIEVTRRDLKDLRVVSRPLGERVALLRMTDLRAGAAALCGAKLAQLREAGVKDIVLDLRENVGGDPQEALAVADLFAPAGPAFQRETRAGATVAATTDAAAWEGGLVVLVGRGTVGEAEILAHALRSLRGAKLVGAPTLGKTSQIDLVRLDGGHGLYVPVATYLKADGTPFDADGIAPDERVARNAADAAAEEADEAETDGDTEDGAPSAPPEAPGTPDPSAPPAPSAPSGATAPSGASGPAVPESGRAPEDPQVKKALELLAAPAGGSAGQAAPPAAASSRPRKAA